MSDISTPYTLPNIAPKETANGSIITPITSLNSFAKVVATLFVAFQVTS
jgi:hypothetical protein